MTAEESLTEALGFKVEDGQVKTKETRKDSFDQKVPMGVRPATEQEKALWSLLVIYRNVIDAGSNG